MKKILSALALSVVAMSASAISITDTTSISDIVFDVRIPGADVANCNTMVLNITTGDAALSSAVVYGDLRCSSLNGVANVKTNVVGALSLLNRNTGDMFFQVTIGYDRKMNCRLNGNGTMSCTYRDGAGTTFPATVFIR